MTMYNINLLELLKTAILAGNEIIKIYHTDFNIEVKSDNSPLTKADKLSHQCICTHLNTTYPAIPIISEEGKHLPFPTRKDWSAFWLIDPLDGTKEFIKRNGEFTINIALIENNYPTLGIIYLPVKETLYFAVKDSGAYKLNNAKQKFEEKKHTTINEIKNTSQKLPIKTTDRPYTVVASRSHMSEETKNYISDLKKVHPNLNIISSGSSLKFCLVAEGSADIYPRFAPTSEWDTAAAQAIVSETGKNVFDYTTGQIMTYNKENLRNNYFVVK